MMKIICRHFFLFLILFSVMRCATPGSLTGGPRDEQPPQLDSLLSTPNMQTNFTKQAIELTFDEWIKLKDIFNEVVISPPIQPKEEITLKGKTVRVEFDEDVAFRKNATYTINFGDAVQDLTESNPAEDLRFVFSTGAYIDSLEVSGIVKDALTKEAVEDVLVMLYDNLADSIVRKERPFYFAKTDKSGNYRISNVRADTFKVFALKESIANYLFDFNNEFIGFPDSFLIVTDSTSNKVDLEIFQESASLEVKKVDKSKYGLIKIAFNQRPLDLTFKYEANIEDVLFDYEKDSLRIWYDLNEQENWQLIFSQDTLISDTVRVSKEGRAAFIESGNLRLQKGIQKSINQNPLRPLDLLFNHPVILFDSTRIRLYEDTLRTLVIPKIHLDSTSTYRKLQVQYPWKEKIPYELEILPNALTDIYDLSNKDSIVQTISVKALEDFGSIILTVSGLDSTAQYILEVGLDNAPPIGTFILSDISSWQQTFKGVATGKYSVKITSDINRNGKWDTGNYDLKTKPESIFTKALEPLRPSWDLEIEVVLEKSR